MLSAREHNGQVAVKDLPLTVFQRHHHQLENGYKKAPSVAAASRPRESHTLWHHRHLFSVRNSRVQPSACIAHSSMHIHEVTILEVWVETYMLRPVQSRSSLMLLLYVAWAHGSALGAADNITISPSGCAERCTLLCEKKLPEPERHKKSKRCVVVHTVDVFHNSQQREETCTLYLREASRHFNTFNASTTRWCSVSTTNGINLRIG